jgi:ribosomal protein L34E
MKPDDPDRMWDLQSQAVHTTLQKWRKQHPKATLLEIEQMVDAHLGPLRAHLAAELAQASSSQDWPEKPRAEQPRCEVCGTVLQARGRQKRRLQTTGGAMLEIERTYGSCPTCGQGLFPHRTRSLV